MDFITWVVSQVPAFLWAEPMRYFVGFFFAYATIGLLKNLCHIGGGYR